MPPRGAHPASPALARAGLAVAIMAQTIIPMINNAFRRTVNNHSNFLSYTANNLVFGHLGVALCVLPDALAWFMGLFARIMSTPSLPYPTAVPSIGAGPQHDKLAPVYVYETFEFGYIAATQPPAPPIPSSTMSEWPFTYRELYWSTFRASPLFSFASDPTPFNEVAIWVGDKASQSQDFLRAVAYPLAAVFVLIAITFMVGKMIDRMQVSVSECAKRAARAVWRFFRTFGCTVGSIGLLLTLRSYGHMSPEDCTEAIVYELVGHPQVAVLAQAFISWASDCLQRLSLSLVSIRTPPASTIARKLPLASARVVQGGDDLAAPAVRFFNMEWIARFYLRQPSPPPAASTNRPSLNLGERVATYTTGLLWRIRIAVRDELTLWNTMCHRALAGLIAMIPPLPPYWGHTVTLFYLGTLGLAIMVVYSVPRFVWVSGFIYWYDPTPWNNLVCWAGNWVLDRMKEDPLLGPIVHRLLLVRLDEDPYEQYNASATSEQTNPAPMSTAQEAPPNPVVQEADPTDEERRAERRRRKAKKRATQSAPVRRVPDPTAFHERVSASLPRYRPDGRLRHPHLSSPVGGAFGSSTPSQQPAANSTGVSEGGSASAGRASGRRLPARVQDRATISYIVTPTMISSPETSPQKGAERSVAVPVAPSLPSPVRASPATPEVEVRSVVPPMPGSPVSPPVSSCNVSPVSVTSRGVAPSPSTPPAPGSPASSSVPSRNASPPRVVSRGATPSPSIPSGPWIHEISTPPPSPPLRQEGVSETPCVVPALGPLSSAKQQPEEVQPAYNFAGVSPGSESWNDLWVLMGCGEYVPPLPSGSPLLADSPLPSDSLLLIDFPLPSEPTSLEPSPDASMTHPQPVLVDQHVASEFCALIQRSIPNSVFGNQEEDRNYVYQATLSGKDLDGGKPMPPSKRVGTIVCKRKRRERSESPEDLPHWRVDPDPDTTMGGPPPSILLSPTPWMPASPSPAPRKKEAPFGELHLSRWAPGNEGKVQEEVLVFELNRAMMEMIAQFEHLSISSLQVIEWVSELPEVEMAETMDEVEGSQGLVQMELDFIL